MAVAGVFRVARDVESDLHGLRREGVRRRLDEMYAEGGLEAVDRRKVFPVVHGALKAAEEILEFAKNKDVDLIVMGASHPGGFDAPLGSTAEKVVRKAHCSVFTVRARGNSSRA